MFRRRKLLAHPNVSAGWMDIGDWRQWPPPASVVRGESTYRDALFDLCGEGASHQLVPVEARLAVEPSNPHDRNAVRVEVRGRLVGYIAREVAAQLSPPLREAECWSFTVAGLIRGSFDQGHVPGVHLWLDRLISPGPAVRLPSLYLVEAWPPHPAEGKPG